MLFNSFQFLIFFPIVLLGYYLIPKKIRHFWLLLASYYFYMCWNAKYALLILLSTVITYASGRLLEAIREKGVKSPADAPAASLPDGVTRRMKWVVAGSFLTNLGILFFFKYANFFFSVLAQAFAAAHIALNMPQFDVLLPVGISFYTFQALSYTMDVYRGEIRAEKDFFRYALFVSFFPQLVAGPIERSKNLLSQLREPKPFTLQAAFDGILLMLWGYFLKIVVADRLALFVDTIYADPINYGGTYLILATILFAAQIYCDFAGYSIIAMGAAEILGIKLTENFNAPYFATSVAEFWRNWHISLTTWFRDYLYFPLGGSRRGTLRKYRNIMIVFLVSGLWHGASFTYVLWGGINGLYQVLGEIFKPVRKKVSSLLHLNPRSLGSRIVATLWTFFLIDVTFIFFRTGRLKETMTVIKQIVTVHNPGVLFTGELYDCGLDRRNFWFAIITVAIILSVDFCKHRGITIRGVIARQDAWFKCVFVALAIVFLLTFGKYGPAYDAANFIYFQF